MVLISTPPLPPHAVDIPGQMMEDFEGNNTSFEGGLRWPDCVREWLWFSHLLESQSLSAPEDKLINDQVKQRIHGGPMSLDSLFSIASQSEAISSRTR
ncbi:hypothetical protein M378DRAFT_850956 [Amanita muscaria Koide BX008]|uniref:Uncharacterized protein n=1 Tax=Amanita muscaria (strain Koide BX008) TaxID=946122 RepID=A0A0C2WXP7_AMAMK|nr:hypothetical protein M378DRAFT_850956 [Amanita muscaria Koide BX008]